MLEALWSVEFISNLGSYGAGVAVVTIPRKSAGCSSLLRRQRHKSEAGWLTQGLQLSPASSCESGGLSSARVSNRVEFLPCSQKD